MPTGAVCNQARLDSNIAKCICNNGFRGDNCMIECKGGSSNPCSGHGTCGADGSCTCTLGWTGSACENACPGQDLPCSGHGTCVGINVTGCSVGCYQVSPTSPPLCNCQAGIQGKISYYYGADCSQPGKLTMFTLSHHTAFTFDDAQVQGTTRYRCRASSLPPLPASPSRSACQEPQGPPSTQSDRPSSSVCSPPPSPLQPPTSPWCLCRYEVPWRQSTGC